MPLARIVTRNTDHDSDALNQLSGQLRAAGYDIEIVQPGAAGTDAALVVELDELAAGDALDFALRLAEQSNADLYLAPGLFAAEQAPDQTLARDLELFTPPMPAEPPLPRPSFSHEDAEPVMERARADDVPSAAQRSRVFGETLENVGAALADGKAGIRESVSGVRSRLAESWAEWQQRRDASVRQRRLERERREMEREERRRQHELELQRRAEERQQLIAERERMAAEQARVMREQMAQEAALRAERERIGREQMAREAALRTELAYAEEQERRRRAAADAERLRQIREQEAQRAAVLHAERLHLQREQEARRLAEMAAAPPHPAATPPAELRRAPVINPARASSGTGSGATPPPRVAAPVRGLPKPTRRPRRVPSPRERQWQRAAFIASVATLAAMIGFAIAADIHPRPPLPASLIQNEAQQQVPFGPAKMDVSSAKPPEVLPSSPRVKAVAPPSSRPNLARHGDEVPQATSGGATSRKPSAAKPTPKRNARSSSGEREVVADDEVVVRHLTRAHTQQAQSTPGVKRYSDEN